MAAKRTLDKEDRHEVVDRAVSTVLQKVVNWESSKREKTTLEDIYINSFGLGFESFWQTRFSLGFVNNYFFGFAQNIRFLITVVVSVVCIIWLD